MMFVVNGGGGVQNSLSFSNMNNGSGVVGWFV